VHEVIPGDICWGLAQKYGITVDQIERWNKNTPGWTNRDLIFPGMKLCVSPGFHPDSPGANPVILVLLLTIRELICRYREDPLIMFTINWGLS
jgi:LysM repeat protein